MQEIIDKAFENPVVEKIRKFASASNYKAFLIGGFVRDLFLYRDSKDIDIVVEQNGLQFAEDLAAHLGASKVSVFKTYGTAQIIYKDIEIEVVNARKESYSSDSRKPSVSPGTLQDDQNRRDFTINALAISLSDKPEIIDPFDGIADLDSQTIITPLDPNITFSDDPLRMMRAVRFASQLGFKIDDTTFDAICKNADRLSIISQERVTDEFNKIMLSPIPSIGFNLLDQSGLLKQFFPEFLELKGVDKINGLSHKDNFYHTLEVLDNVATYSKDLWLRYAAVFHDIAKPRTKRFEPKIGFTFHGHEDKGSRMVKPIFRRMKLPLNDQMKYVEKLVLLHLRPIALTKDIVTDSAIRRLLVDAGNDINDLILLCKCDITSKNESKKEKYLKNLEGVRKKIAKVIEGDEIRNWQPLISGNDIINWVNLEHPKQIGIIKQLLKDAILDGVLNNTLEDSKEFVVAKAIQMGLSLKNEDAKH